MFSRPVLKRVARIALLATICNLLAAPAVFAAGSPQGSPQGTPPAAAEALERHTATSRHIRNADGTVTAEIYASPVYFKDSDGKWLEIRNRVVRQGNRPGLSWKNEANCFTVSFADELGTGLPLRLEVDGSWMEYGFTVSARRAAKVKHNVVSYETASDDLDLVYTVESDGVEEEIVLHSAKAGSVFSFSVSTNTTVAGESDGSIGFYNSSGAKVWSLFSSVMRDSAGAESTALRYGPVETRGADVSLTLEADGEWLADPARVYPVVIDPSIVLQPDPASGMDAYISGLQGSTSTNYGGEAEIKVGNATVSGNHAIYRGLLKFNLSSIPKSLITDARLEVYKSSGSAASTRNVDFALHAVTTQWLEGEVTWAKATQAAAWAAVGGDFVEQPICTMTINADSSVGWYSSPGPESSTLASVVSGWVNGNATNCGILMKRVEEPQADTVEIKLRSSDYADLALRPKLTVTYVEDTAPPTVEFLTPQAGACLSGTVTVSANAMDVGDAPTGVSRVEFYVDGGLRASVAEPPYEFTWDTSQEGNGVHRIALKAYDGAENVGQFSEAVLLSDSFTDGQKVDSGLTTAEVDTGAGVVRLPGTVSAAQVASAAASTTLPQPSFPLGYLSDGNNTTVWKSAGKTVASATETITLDWSSTWSIAYIDITPANVADGLQAKVELINSLGAVVKATSYQTLASSPTSISTDRTSARSARITLTNLRPDPISGQFHANVAEIKVLRYYLEPYYVYTLQASGYGISSADDVRGDSASGPINYSGFHDLFYSVVYSIVPSNASATMRYSAPYSWVDFSGGSYNDVQDGTLGTAIACPDTLIHKVDWSAWDSKTGNSYLPADHQAASWVSTNFTSHYTDCWVSNWYSETRPITFYIYVERDVHDYSALYNWSGYRQDTYYQAVYPAVAFTATASEQYSFTYPAANAIDGNPNTAWVSAGKPDRLSTETLDLTLAAPTLINRVTLKPRMNGMSAKVYTWENGAWVQRSEISVLLEGSYAFPDTTTDRVRLEFSSLQGSNPYYAGVAEASVGYGAYSPSGVLVSRPQGLPEVAGGLTLQVDDSAPAGTSIAYEVTADGTNWEAVTPGVFTVLEHQGAEVTVRATLLSNNAWATPEIRSWRVERPGQGLTVTVQNGGDTAPPLVAIIEPAAGSTVSGLVTIRAHASDDSAVSRVLFLVDGQFLAADTTLPYEASWETRPGSGAHEISVVAYDSAGNSSVARTFNVVALADSFASADLVDPQNTTARVDTASGSVTLPRTVLTGQNWPVALGEWHYRRAVSLGNSSVYDHTGEPVRVTVTDPRVKTGGADIRVTDPSGTVIAHRLVTADDVSKTYVVQFEARSVPRLSTWTYYVYYGNADASDASVTNKETAYEPMAPLVVHMSRYAFWRNDQYFEAYTVGTSQRVSGDDVYSSVTMSFAWPYAVETETSSSVNTVTIVYVSTNGRVHRNTQGILTKVLDPAVTSDAQWVAWLNSDQNGAAGAGAKAATGNLPAGHKFYSSGVDSGGSTVRSGSAILFTNGRVHINVDMGRGTTGYMGNPGLCLRPTKSYPNYSYWTWTQNACYVLVLDPMSAVVGNAESHFVYPPSGVVQSVPIALDQGAMTATVSATQETPVGTAITYDLSVDGGQSWQPAALGQMCAFPAPGQSVVIRANLTSGDIWATPTLYDWGVTIAETTEAAVTTLNEGPCAPTSLRAKARGGEATIDLVWEPSITPDATYTVYRGSEPGFALDAAHEVASGLTGTSWSDTTCVSGTGYYYRVTAVLGAYASLPTNEASAIAGVMEDGRDRLGLEGLWAFAGAKLGGDQGYINVRTGNLVLTSTDLARSAPSIGIAVRRTYNSMSTSELGFGYGWDLNSNYALSEDEAGNVTLKEGDGSVHVFSLNPDGTYARPAGVFMDLSKHPDGRYSILRKDGLDFAFDASGKITGISDRNGNSLLYSYTPVPGVGDRLTGITDLVGRLVTLTYDPAGHLAQVTDWEGRAYSYAYDVQGNLCLVTDPAGNQTAYRYDAYHQLTSVADRVGNETLISLVDGKCQSITAALGQVTSFTYDPVARRTTVTDSRNNSTLLEYDQVGSLTKRTDALGRSTLFQYDADGNLTQLTDVWNNTWLYHYDSAGNMDESNDPSETTTVAIFNQFNLPDRVSVYSAPDRSALLADAQFTYDDCGNVLSAAESIDASQGTYRTTTFHYDPARPGFVDAATDPRGNVAEYTYDVYGYPETGTRYVNLPGGGTAPVAAETQYDSLGNLASVSDPGGNVTRYEYDLLGRPTNVFFPDGTSESVAYDAQGNAEARTDGNGRRTTYEYDRLGRALTVVDPLGNETTLAYDDANDRASITKPGGICTTYEYDRIGRLKRVIDGVGQATVYTYDATMNKVTVTDPKGHWVTGTYDYRGLLTAYTNAVGTTTIAYDKLGYKTSVTDPNNKVIAYTYDDLGRLESVMDPMGEVITYEYDENNNMTRMTTRVRDSGGQYVDRVTTYAYDELSRRTAVTLPDLQGTGQVSSSYTYNANGNQATRTDGKGQTTDYEYDSRSRLIQVRYPSGAEMSYTYDAVGNPLTMRDGVGITVYHYDALNRLTSETDPFGRTVQYSYDDVARIGTLSTDWGTITYQSNILGQLETVTDPSGGVTRYHYDMAGNCNQVDYPNGDVITCAYDNVDRLTEIKGVHGATVISDYDYTYDDVGNRLTMTDSTGTRSYQYDGDYRLKKVTRPDSSHTEYSYDEAGNRTQMTVTTGGTAETTTYAYDLNDRLTLVTHSAGPTTSYEYDANGNQLRLVEPQGTTVFAYDDENRLTGIGFPTGASVEYEYDGQSRRLRMKDPNVEVFYQYGMGQVISDRDGAGAVIAYYVRGLGGRLISDVQTAGTLYYHFDGLGSVVALTDSAGTKVSSYTYDEFGGLTQSTGQSWNSFGYTSSIHDSAPGLYLMGSRYYDPALGRFITQDTWGGNAYDPWTKNLYAYGRGNPVTYIDPTGHSSIHANEGAYEGYNWVDLQLVYYKMLWANAQTDADRQAAADAAGMLRAENPGGYKVQMTDSLDSFFPGGSTSGGAPAALLASGTGSLVFEGAFNAADVLVLGLVALAVAVFADAIATYVPRAYQADVARCSENAEIRVSPPQGLFLFRFWGGAQPKAGFWYSPFLYGSPESARAMLALPDRNAATNVTLYWLPPGVKCLWSIASDMRDMPGYGDYAVGGGPQVNVTNPGVLIEIGPVRGGG